MLGAQTAPAEADWTTIEQKLEAMRIAVTARDIKKAADSASDLSQFTSKEWFKAAPKPADYLREAEARVATTPQMRARNLPWMARLAYDAGDMAKAEQYAREALNSPENLHPAFDSIHDGNMVLGLIAAKNGDTAAAKAYLLAAAKTPGTTITRRFGPNMKLAAELSKRGESATVVAYLESVRKYMTDKHAQIDDTIAMLKGGRQPDFGSFEH